VGNTLGNQEKTLIDKEVIDKIKSGLNNIRLITKEKAIKKEAEELINLLRENDNRNILSLEEKIFEKMKETKNSDPDMNANLYILYRKLVNKQISEQQALQLFEMYVKIEPYDNRLY
jgi:hypothetical protein